MSEMRILRPRPTMQKLGVGRTNFIENYVEKEDAPFVPGTTVRRLRKVPLGLRAIGFLSDEVDELIEGVAT